MSRRAARQRSDDVADEHRHRQFMHLLDAHGGAVAGMLRRLCRNRHDAEDVFQDTAARVWRHLPAALPSVRNPAGWLMTIAYRAFADARGRLRRQPVAVGAAVDGRDAPTPDPVDAAASPPDRAAERSETFDRVQSAVAELPDPVREVVVMHYLGGLSIGETAAAMGLSAGTVKSRLNAALRTLRGVLEAPE